MRTMTEKEKAEAIKIRSVLREQSEFKRRVALAKCRMKKGYWTEMAAEREKFLRQEGDTPENRQRISRIQRSRFIRENVACADRQEMTEEEKLYIRVCDMLDRDEDTSNPIGQLIDYEKYNYMDESSKQRYVLFLVRQYNELKERYYEERAIKFC